MEGVRGGAAAPGQYRIIQNYVVNSATVETIYTPPPAHDVPVIWRDWLTDKVMVELGLNNRQLQAVEYLKLHTRITNAEYQQGTGALQRTATRDLNDLVQKGVLEIEGKGRGAQYRFLHKRAGNTPNTPSGDI